MERILCKDEQVYLSNKGKSLRKYTNNCIDLNKNYYKPDKALGPSDIFYIKDSGISTTNIIIIACATGTAVIVGIIILVVCLIRRKNQENQEKLANNSQAEAKGEDNEKKIQISDPKLNRKRTKFGDPNLVNSKL